jgi:putative transposase
MIERTNPSVGDRFLSGGKLHAGCLMEVRRDLCVWLVKWQGRYPKLCNRVEENIEKTFTFCRRLLAHHKHLKSTNMLERVNLKGKMK